MSNDLENAQDELDEELPPTEGAATYAYQAGGDTYIFQTAGD